MLAIGFISVVVHWHLPAVNALALTVPPDAESLHGMFTVLTYSAHACLDTRTVSSVDGIVWRPSNPPSPSGFDLTP